MVGRKYIARVTKPCAHCGKDIAPRLPKELEKIRFCSAGCYAISTRTWERPTYTCKTCSKDFSRKLSGTERAKGHVPSYCCEACTPRNPPRTKPKYTPEQKEQNRLDGLAASEARQEERQRRRSIKALAKAIARVAWAQTNACECCSAWIRRGRKRCDACLHSSARARKAKGKAVRRSRLKADHTRFDPIAVFKRDKWKCKLCGTSTPMSNRGTNEPNAPELDHIIALADGGAHAMWNTQCACRTCNGLKGANSRGQLWLGL